MRRRQFEEEHENHERWMVSYADFITLLFAFFVVMYAISSVNQGKYQLLTSSLGNAFTGEISRQKLDATAGGNTDHTNLPGQYSAPSFIKPLELTRLRNEKLRREREAMSALAINVSNGLAPLIQEGKVKVLQNNRGIRIDIHDSLLFSQGSADLQPVALAPLTQITDALKQIEKPIQVEGHTDNIPIHNDRFYSNWELSAMRASSVVRMLEGTGIAGQRLSAIGFGPAQPLSENDTPLGRARNRRVSIIVLYESPYSSARENSEILPEKAR